MVSITQLEECWTVNPDARDRNSLDTPLGCWIAASRPGLQSGNMGSSPIHPTRFIMEACSMVNSLI